MVKLYFDSSATSRIYPQVVKEMNEAMNYLYANPSSEHELGNIAQKRLLAARINIARAVGAKPQEIFFTSGTTESNNWALRGLARANPNKKKVLISAIEHPSIREVCKYLEESGYKIIEIPVDKEGFVDTAFIERNIDSNTLVVSVMHANNIFGTVQHLKMIGDLCKKKKVFFHTDAAQSIGKMKILVHDWNVDLLSASTHKIGGPKGVGILYVRDGIKIRPLIYGGGQEKGLRSGTENIAGIIGFEIALQISMKKDWENVKKIRDYLINGLEKIGAKLVGCHERRLANNIFITIPDKDSEQLLYQLSERGIYVSRGSACDSKKEIEDKALLAIGLSSKEIKSSLRISLPVDVTKKEADYFLKILKEMLEQ